MIPPSLLGGPLPPLGFPGIYSPGMANGLPTSSAENSIVSPEIHSPTKSENSEISDPNSASIIERDRRASSSSNEDLDVNS